MPDGPMYTKQLKDAFCVYKIFENIPEHPNKGYKGKIRELLQPALEDITVFDINTFIRELRKFEEDWTMFEEKPKPTAPTEDAQANLATKKKKKKSYEKIDITEVKKLKKRQIQRNSQQRHIEHSNRK